MCDRCFNEFKEILKPIISNCKFKLSYKCNFCVRQPPSLRSFAAKVAFYFITNIDQSELTRNTTYEEYELPINSKKVAFRKFVPDSYPTLNCDFMEKKY